MSIEKWVTNANGNYIALGHNGLIATVYETDDGCWSAVLNDATEHEAMKAVDQLEHGGNGLQWIRRQ